MAIARPDYSCRHCGHRPTEHEIAETHFTKKCPACEGSIELDAPGALTRSRGAALAGIVGMVLAISLCAAVLSALGITGNKVQAWPQAVRLGLAVAIFFTGVAAGFSFQRAWVKRMLARVRKQMEADAKL